MVEQTPCPVCTLYLHPGMSLADHLETHPKEQVIKALVSLANSSASLTPCRPTSIGAITATKALTTTATGIVPSPIQKSQNRDDSLFHTPPAPPPPLIQRGYPQLQGLSSTATDTTGFMNSRESKNGYIPSNQRNLMIVNRQSTMVYQAGDHNQSILGQQISLAPPPLQLFNIPSHHNQGKFLTPPPAYGTAISQLRSQNNQSNISYNRQHQSQFGNSSNSAAISSTTSHCNVSDQSALDFTMTKNLLSRQNSLRPHQQQPQTIIHQSKYHNSSSSLPSPAAAGAAVSILKHHTSPRCRSTSSSPRLRPSPTPSPSVLRYAESPVTAHYVERDNGDFIVQETPRHLVECVEKDNGEFSVIEKVICSPPSVVQFHDSDETEDNHYHNQQEQNHQEEEQQNHTSEDETHDIEMEVHQDDDDSQKNDNGDELKKKEQENEKQDSSIKQKKTFSGLTVISNVKLNPNESLDLMENIMASSNNNEVEVFWSGIVNPIIEKIEIEEKEKERIKERFENKTEKSETDINVLGTSQQGLPTCEQESMKVEENISKTEVEETIHEEETVSIENDESNKIQSQCSTSLSTPPPSSSSASATTSVIRLASAPISVPSAIEITKVPEPTPIDHIQKENENKTQTILTPISITSHKSSFTRETIKRPFRKAPKKLVLKFKSTPINVNRENSDKSQIDERNEPRQGPSSMITTTSDKSKSNSESLENEINSEKPILNNETKLEEEVGSAQKQEEQQHQQQKEQQNQQEEGSKNEDNSSEQMNKVETLETKEEEEEEKDNDVTIVSVAPPIPDIQPMIVYESSLMDPNDDSHYEDNYDNGNDTSSIAKSNDNGTVVQSKDKYSELSKLFDNCWKSNNQENKAEVNNQINNEFPTEEIFIATITAANAASENNSSGVNSLEIPPAEITIISSSNSNNNSNIAESSSSSCLSPSLCTTTANTTLNSFPSTSNFSSLKPSTSSSLLQQQKHTEQQQPQQQQLQNNNNNHQQAITSLSSNYNIDYPFSLLYSNNDNNIVDKNRLSPLYPSDLWKNYNGPIFHTQTTAAAAADFQDIEERERSSYIDLDSLKKANSSDAVQYCEALNIRTDEKMPAKGEISEQESNGDIENSWSQPLGGNEQQPYRFFNHIENYVARESWSDEGFICPQTVVEDIKPKPSLIPQSSTGETSQTETVSRIKKARKPRKTNIGNSSSSGSSNTTTTAKKTKIFTCDHCPCTFPKLKERNLHLILHHDYKRVNRRLVREPPPATITSAQQGLQQDLLQQQQQQQHYQFEQLILLQQQENQQQTGIIASASLSSFAITAGEDVKPDTTVATVSSTLETQSQQFPRTKYDSMRAGVYRMLMNFNFSVLKEKQNIEFDESLFESKTFCCFTCKRNFISVKQYDEHLADHPAECFTCGRKFTRWSYFSIHLKRHLGWKDFECTHCNKRFVIRSALIEHMRMHTGISPLKCKQCGKCFKRYSNLTQHKRLCHSTRSKKKKEYVCYCGEVLPSKARFIWHREIHDTKPKCCPYCRDRFIHSNSLRRHIRLVHSEKFTYDQPAECPICNQVYAKNSLKGHMSTHSMDTQHECAICNKSFSTKWNLKIHSWVHANRTAKPFKCDLCVKAFVREIDYKNHINAHKQIKPFTCEYCGCKFIRKYNYLRHRREHHGQKKFRCELCGKQFHRHYYLIEHRRTHTGERPFLCTICGKSSTTKTNHNKHLKIHHSRDPFTSET